MFLVKNINFQTNHGLTILTLEQYKNNENTGFVYELKFALQFFCLLF